MKKDETKNYGSQIIHSVMTPCFMTEDEFEEGYKQSIFWTDKEFYSEYAKHMAGMSHIAECAKVYILKNWEKVTDWSGLEVRIYSGYTGKNTLYYTYKDDGHKWKGTRSDSKIWDRIEKKRKADHNPILEITEVVLDPTDGDFSITINGNEEHWWIHDEGIIIIADYIEKSLASVSK